MDGFVIRRLTVEDKDLLLSLINVIEENLEQKSFWLPMSQEDKVSLVTNDKIATLGLFDGDILVGTTSLFWEPAHISKYVGNLKLEQPVATIGRGMVLPEYRRQGVASLLIGEVISIAEQVGIKTLVASAHHANKGSIQTLRNAGFEFRDGRVMTPGYPRSIYVRTCR